MYKDVTLNKCVPCGAPVAATKEQQPIALEMQNIEFQLANLEENISATYDKLRVILAPSMPEKLDDSEKAKESCISQLAEMLFNFKGRIRRANDLLEDILNRIEL